MASKTHSWNKPAADRVLLPEEEKQTDKKQKFCDLGTCPKEEDLRLEWLCQEVGTSLNYISYSYLEVKVRCGPEP